MGPRFCKRGNLADRRTLLIDAEMLQWGHAFVSVETSAIPRGNPWRLRASMGPRFCKRGNYVSLERPRTQRGLQWGHAFVNVETNLTGVLTFIERMLQRGHAFVSVETSTRARRCS